MIKEQAMSAIIKIPPNIRVVDMCIYIDNNVYKEKFDETKIFEYLHNIVYLLSVKHKLLTEWSDYEPFALYAAGKLYLRLTDKRQFLPESDKKKLKKITSILNYIKTVLHPYIVDYQQENYTQCWSSEDEVACQGIEYNLVSKVRSDSSVFLRIEFEDYIKRISCIIKDFLRRSPYYNDKATMKCIYISCLLTLVKSMTLSRENITRLNNKFRKGSCNDYLIEVLYRQEAKEATTLYHLPSHMANYITTLSNQIKRLISKDISEMIMHNEPSEEMIKCILSSGFINEDNNDA